jgi:predicted lipoprotein with Yx(FWY)xxD motif
MRNARRETLARSAAVAVALAAALLAAACSSSSSSGPSLLSGNVGGNKVALLQSVKTVADGTVLTNGTGYTLYWFSKDKASYSGCDAVCVPQWPPVTGKPQSVSGTTLGGHLGTLIRANGAVQATYDGHPLYTFAGDEDPGDVGGNDVTQFGGKWHVVRPS